MSQSLGPGPATSKSIIPTGLSLLKIMLYIAKSLWHTTSKLFGVLSIDFQLSDQMENHSQNHDKDGAFSLFLLKHH